MADRKRTGLIFGPAPPGRKHDHPYDWDAIAEELREHPGEWAQVYVQDRASLAVAIRSNKIRALKRERGFESRTANNTREAPLLCDLYLRYVPEKDESKEN